ncbi:hypothetical protein [Micromonospora chokoriensis]
MTVWEGSFWKNDGEFHLGERRYRLIGNIWSRRFALVDDQNNVIAEADQVTRKQWTVQVGNEAHRLRRASFWSSQQELLAGDRVVGTVKRAGFWGGGVGVDLPGLPLPAQIFVLGIVLVIWRQQSASAAAAGS